MVVVERFRLLIALRIVCNQHQSFPVAWKFYINRLNYSSDGIQIHGPWGICSISAMACLKGACSPPTHPSCSSLCSTFLDLGFTLFLFLIGRQGRQGIMSILLLQINCSYFYKFLDHIFEVPIIFFFCCQGMVLLFIKLWFVRQCYYLTYDVIQILKVFIYRTWALKLNNFHFNTSATH